MQANETPAVADHRELIEQRLSAAPGVLLALDFDGTLTPIVDDPDEASLAETPGDVLADLATVETVEVAIVSGRELADLRDRVGISGVNYAGNHGLEFHVEGDRTVPDRAQEFSPTVEEVSDVLADRLADVEGCIVENKGLTATVHVRNVPEPLRDGVQQVVRDAVAETDEDLVVTEGKAIWEIRPPVEWDKGRAVERLVDRTPEDWLSIYVGDDITDEDAFDALATVAGESVSVLVGDREPTAADYRLRSRANVVDFLSLVTRRHAPTE